MSVVSFPSRLAATTLALFLTTALASAESGKALFEKMIAGPEGKGSVTYGSVSEADDGSFSAQGVTLISGRTGQAMQIAALSVQNMREAGDAVTWDALAMKDVSFATPKGEAWTVGTLASTQASVPNPTRIGRDRERLLKQRVRLGTLSIGGISMSGRDGSAGLQTFTMNNADIPLRWAFGRPTTPAAALAAPMTSDLVRMEGLSGSARGVQWTLGEVRFDKVNLPTGMSSDLSQWLKLYETVRVAGLDVKIGGKTVVSMGEMKGSLKEEDGTGRSTGQIDTIRIDLKALPNPQAVQMANAFGYEEIDLSVTADGSYNPTTGRASVDTMDMRLKDMFDASFSYVLQGYTGEVVQALQEAQAAVARGMNQAEAYGPLMGTLANLKLERLGLSLTDRSLLGKVLDFQAAQMGTTGEQLAQGVPMMIGLGMAQLNMPDFTDMVSRAVGTFLRDKGTLSIEAAPPEPVSVIGLVATGQADPKRVPLMLNLRVSAQ